MNERLNEKIYPAHSLIEVNVNETFGQTDNIQTDRQTDRQDTDRQTEEQDISYIPPKYFVFALYRKMRKSTRNCL